MYSLNVSEMNFILINAFQFKRYIVILQYNDIDMGITKSEIFTIQQNEIAMIAKAFGHPARVAILQYIIKSKSCICGDLVEEIGLAQPTISQHLKELKNLGLITGNVEGTSVCYCINQKKWKQALEIFSKFLEQGKEVPSKC